MTTISTEQLRWMEELVNQQLLNFTVHVARHLSLTNEDIEEYLEPICFEVGKNLKLHDYIQVGKQNSDKSSIQNKMISDACEALIGAVYLDKGFEYTE